MPITNQIKITPTVNNTDRLEFPLVTEGIYNASIEDITYIPGEQNSFNGKPQLKLKFKILDDEFKDVCLTSWVGMSLNPGWDKGNPSHLYTIAKSVMGEEPNLDIDFYPNVLMGGKLKIWVEIRESQAGKKYSRIVKYSSSSKEANKTVEGNVIKEQPLSPEPEGENINVDDINF